MIYLRNSTSSQEIPLGPFLDDTDGKTAETGLSIANTDIKIWKNGATSLVNKNSGGATHISNGIYYAVLDATDASTDGPMVIYVSMSGALPVRVECCVLPADKFGWFLGSSTPSVAIASNGITASSIFTGAITASAIASNAITDAKIATDAIAAAKIASDAVTKIQSGLATGTNLATVDTVVDAIKLKTDNLPSSPAATGDAMALTSGERNSTAAALLDLANGIESSVTLRQALRAMLAALAGELSGAATTEVTIRDVNDTKDRIVATVDEAGNRSAITLDLT